MLLYHVSTDLNHNGNFRAIVPESRMFEEEGETARISFSESIEGCLTGMPGSKQSKLNSLNDNNNEILVYTIDTKEIPRDLIMNYRDLHRTGYVPDAKISQESWVMCDLQLKAESYVIEEFDTRSEYIVPVEVEMLMNENSMSLLNAFELFYDEKLCLDDLPEVEKVVNLKIRKSEGVAA